MKSNTLHRTNFLYYQKGDHPKLLIHAGTHGDESESISLVTAALKRFAPLLPSFLYVPEVSPSAVARRTRKNGRDKDLNRIFFDNSTDNEVMWNQEIITMGPFDLAVSFHEDPQYDAYYIYDEGSDNKPTPLITQHINWLQKQGIKLLNGYDDPDDPHLGEVFENGYKRFAFKDSKPSGMIFNWAMRKNLINHTLVPEIPGLVDLSTKQFIIESIIEQIIIPYF